MIMREMFTCPIDNTKPETIEKAKKIIFETASEMGFTNYDEFVVSKYKDIDGSHKYALNANFNT